MPVPILNHLRLLFEALPDPPPLEAERARLRAAQLAPFARSLLRLRPGPPLPPQSSSPVSTSSSGISEPLSI